MSKEIKIISVGKTTKTFIKDGIAEYKKRLSAFTVTDTEIGEKPSVEKECDEILKRLGGYTVLLDVGGEILSSEDLSKLLNYALVEKNGITFIIGGASGVDDRVRSAVNKRISFGRITLPHQLCKLVLYEQIYRAYTINSGLPYHK